MQVGLRINDETAGMQAAGSYIAYLPHLFSLASSLPLALKVSSCSSVLLSLSCIEAIRIKILVSFTQGRDLICKFRQIAIVFCIINVNSIANVVLYKFICWLIFVTGRRVIIPDAYIKYLTGKISMHNRATVHS